MARPLRGGGVKGRVTKKKDFFEKNVATKLEGRGGGKASAAGPLKKKAFLRLPLVIIQSVCQNNWASCESGSGYFCRFRIQVHMWDGFFLYVGYRSG